MARVLDTNDLNTLKQKSPYSLPDNPSDKGLSASQIKAKFYEGLLLLFNWLKQYQIEINTVLNLSNEEVSKITRTLEEFRNTIESLSSKVINNESKINENLELIKSTENNLNEFKLVEQNDVLELVNTISENDTLVRALINSEVQKLLSGDYTVLKAKSDNDGNVLSDTYIKLNRITSDAGDIDDGKIITLGLAKSLFTNLLDTILDGAPEEFDTLKEFADFIANPDNDYFNNIMTQLAKRITYDEAEKNYLKTAKAEEIYYTKTWIKTNVIGNSRKTLEELEAQISYLDDQNVKTINGIHPTGGNIDLAGFTALGLEESGDELMLVSYTANDDSELDLVIEENGDYLELAIVVS